ncbi:hypothetical protein JCM13664_15590 [Methylothermus subterraneus]
MTLQLSPELNLFGGIRYHHEWIREMGPENDAEHALGFLVSRYLLGDHLFVFTTSGGYHHFRPNFNYWEGKARLDWFTRLPLEFEARIGLSYQFRALNFDLYNQTRDNHRFDTNLALIKHFGRLFAEVWWDFGLNRGEQNTLFGFWQVGVVSYDRHAVGINVGLEL